MLPVFRDCWRSLLTADSVSMENERGSGEVAAVWSWTVGMVLDGRYDRRRGKGREGRDVVGCVHGKIRRVISGLGNYSP